MRSTMKPVWVTSRCSGGSLNTRSISGASSRRTKARCGPFCQYQAPRSSHS